MYNIKLTNEEKERIAKGDRLLLLEKLRESDKKLVRDLKTPNTNTAFLQGSSCVVDRLISILKVN